MADDLTFVIHPDAECASVDLLFKSVQDIRRLLRDIDRAIYGPKSRNEWLVGERASSDPSITVRPTLNGQHAAEAVGAGLRAVTSGTDQPPQYFTEQVLDDLSRMKRLFGGKSKVKSIAVLVNGEQTATIQPDIPEKVSRILAAGYHNLGSLQGTLEGLNTHRAPLVTTIWERVSRSPVRCTVPKDEAWIGRIRMLLEKRVTVTGDIHYFANGIPRSVSHVLAIDDATPDPNLPRAEFGSIPDQRVIEVGASEWLRSIRETSGA